MLIEKSITDIKDNPFTLIGNEYMLISAGTPQNHNFMTASWGGLGVLWGRNVATIYIRPSRYTLQFVQEQDYFALSFFGKNKKVHKVGGGMSGRDANKTLAAGITPIFDNGAVYYSQAEMVLICRKLYTSSLDNTKFLDPSIEDFYKNETNNYHKVFVGEIVKVLISDQRA